MNEYTPADNFQETPDRTNESNSGRTLSPPPMATSKTRGSRFWVYPEAATLSRSIYQMPGPATGWGNRPPPGAGLGVQSPPTTASQGTRPGGSKSTVEPTKWDIHHQEILTCRDCGNLINFQSYSKSYKMKSGLKPRRPWIFLNVHDHYRRPPGKSTEHEKRRRSGAHRHPGQRLFRRSEYAQSRATSIPFNQATNDNLNSLAGRTTSGCAIAQDTHYIRLEFLERVCCMR